MTDDGTANGTDADRETKTPEEIRAEIEQTRERLGDTVEALAEKSDLKAQAKSRISAAKDSAQNKRNEYVGKAKRAAPESASAGADQLAATVQEKPLPFAIAVAFVLGLAIGWLLRRPSCLQKGIASWKARIPSGQHWRQSGRRPDQQQALRRDLEPDR